MIAAIEKEPLAWETPEGWKIMRKEDHAVVEDVVWGETAYSEKYGFAGSPSSARVRITPKHRRRRDGGTPDRKSSIDFRPGGRNRLGCPLSRRGRSLTFFP